MGRIAILQPHIANQIAAGEVVERPASVMKELIENAMDAEASAITIEIKNGGIDYMRVTDNGIGILSEDCIIAFERHATSKVSVQEDLERIETLGFRGEALSSIAAVAQVSMRTYRAQDEVGTYIRVEGGACKIHEPAGCPAGTSIEVENLFYNVPARRKFLKSARTEGAYVGEYIARMILSRPDISFRYINNGKLVYQSQGDGSLKNAIYCVYGAETLLHLKEIALDNGYIAIHGWIGTAEIARPNRKDQIFILNRRIIRSMALSGALQRAYDTRLIGGRYPFAVLHMKLSSREVDVNVHPAKLEVRFAQEGRIYTAMLDACTRALREGYAPPAMRLSDIAAHSSASSQAGEGGQQVASPGVAKEPVADHILQPKTGALPSFDRSFTAFTPLQGAQGGGITLKESAVGIPHFRVLQEVEKDIATQKPPTPTHALQETCISPIAIVGQVFKSYWIVQQDETIYFIDQHAAHERKLYEQFMQQAEAATSQSVLDGDVIQLTHVELDILQQHQPLLESLGYQFEAFGPTAVRVTAIPGVVTGLPIARFLREALEILHKQGTATTQEIRKEAIIQSSCKHAVKAGEPLSLEEITDLIAYFQKAEAPLTCPHGRPIMIRLTRREIEKMFKRIVS